MEPISFGRGATLAGAGALDRAAVEAALALAPHLVAADGGADALSEMGFAPEAVVGDMDSLADPEGWERRLGPAFVRIAEQDSTDLDKCLRTVEAPLILGVGFTGRRFDHTLAALNALARARRRRIALIGEEDVIFILPPAWRAEVGTGARVSFAPLAPARGVASSGLRWPIDGLDMAMDGRIGTSNAASADVVEARFEGGPVAVMLDRALLGAAVASLG